MGGGDAVHGRPGFEARSSIESAVENGIRARSKRHDCACVDL